MPSHVPDIQPLPASQQRLLKQFYRSHGSRGRIAAQASCWVARDGGIIAGLCLTPMAGGHWLTNLLVAAEQRNGGVATALLAAVKARVPGPIWLFCRPELIGFYQRRGFILAPALPAELETRLERYRQTKPLVALQLEVPDMPSPPIEIVTAALFDTRGRLLLVRKRGSRYFMLPGGKREPGETSWQTLQRELDEELALQLREGQVQVLGEFEAAAANEPGRRVRAQVFAGRLEGDVRVQAEIEQARWLALPAQHTDDLAPLLREHILVALAGWPR